MVVRTLVVKVRISVVTAFAVLMHWRHRAILRFCNLVRRACWYQSALALSNAFLIRVKKRRMIKNVSFIHTAFVYSTIIVLMNSYFHWEGMCPHAMCRKHLCYFYPEFVILARDVPLTPASCFKFILLYTSMATQETLWHLDCMRSVESEIFMKASYVPLWFVWLWKSK